MPMTGGCLCGTARFEADEFAGTLAHCHCSMCRRFHGAAYATLATVPTGAFRWVAGESDLKHYEAPNKTVRTFCGNCGSSLSFMTPRDGGRYVEVALGAFDDEPPVAPDAHIFTESAPRWTLSTDVLVRYPRERGSSDDNQPPLAD